MESKKICRNCNDCVHMRNANGTDDICDTSWYCDLFTDSFLAEHGICDSLGNCMLTDEEIEGLENPRTEARAIAEVLERFPPIPQEPHMEVLSLVEIVEHMYDKGEPIDPVKDKKIFGQVVEDLKVLYSLVALLRKGKAFLSMKEDASGKHYFLRIEGASVPIREDFAKAYLDFEESEHLGELW